MVIKKSLINDINKKYINKIKELIIINYNKKIICDEMYVVCDEKIKGKKVKFILTYQNTDSLNFYTSGFYIYEPNSKQCDINITVSINNKFDFTDFAGLYFKIKSVIYHEIEHHLQRIKIPFRAFLDFDNYNIEDSAYVNNEAETEAYLKEYYFYSRKKNISFKMLIQTESLKLFENPEHQLKFQYNIFSYLKKRKDLNLLSNIQL